MNNNNPNTYPKYSSPYHNNNNLITSPQQFNPTPQYYTNTLNLPKNDFSGATYFSPTDNHSIKRQKIDRAMYSSTIQPTLPNKSFNLGKLQTMARLVPNVQKTTSPSHQASYQFKSPSIQNYQRPNFGNQQPNQSQGMNLNNKTNDFDRFPSFNLNSHQPTNQNVPNNNYHTQTNKQAQMRQEMNETLSPQQKRRRQILAIKQQLEAINKKMENSNLSKKYTPQTQKNDSKPQQFIPNNNYLISTNNQLGNQFSSGFNKNETNQMPVGLSFSKNSNNLEPYQRNKGMVAQSMIVSTEPAPGYKYQSIFDKYDSLKKPVYQTTNNTQNKDSQQTLLDKFVNKGPGNLKNNQPIQTSTSNNLNNFSNPTNIDKPKYNFPLSNNNSNQTFNGSFSTNSTSSTQASTQPTYQTLSKPYNNSTQPIKEEPTMFKKKKATFAEEIKIETIITDTQNPQKNTFKTTYEQTIVTKAMKQMNIQESVQFKRQDFVVGKKLGKGQFGEVMLVQHKKTGFLCGMKVMEKKQIRDQKYQGQIARQLSIQFYLAHRNIAPLYGYFQDEKNVYLLVEYCTGGQLLEMLRKNRRMEEPQVSRVIRQIIEGIDYIHKQLIIHRDIKPQNILFNFGVAKICDFGWAVYKGHGMRKTASVGSPLYYSPEIVMGVQYDQKIDIWDIGMMTYECLLGKIPFRIYSELDLNRIVEDEIKFPEYIETSDEAKDFILKIMKKKPEDRMEIREMLRHPFITKYQELKLPMEIMKDFKQVLG